MCLPFSHRVPTCCRRCPPVYIFRNMLLAFPPNVIAIVIGSSRTRNTTYRAGPLVITYSMPRLLLASAFSHPLRTSLAPTFSHPSHTILASAVSHPLRTFLAPSVSHPARTFLALALFSHQAFRTLLAPTVSHPSRIWLLARGCSPFSQRIVASEVPFWENRCDRRSTRSKMRSSQREGWL